MKHAQRYCRLKSIMMCITICIVGERAKSLIFIIRQNLWKKAENNQSHCTRWIIKIFQLYNVQTLASSQFFSSLSFHHITACAHIYARTNSRSSHRSFMFCYYHITADLYAPRYLRRGAPPKQCRVHAILNIIMYWSEHDYYVFAAMNFSVVFPLTAFIIWWDAFLNVRFASSIFITASLCIHSVCAFKYDFNFGNYCLSTYWDSHCVDV